MPSLQSLIDVAEKLKFQRRRRSRVINPGRSRGSQSGGEKRRDEIFQALFFHQDRLTAPGFSRMRVIRNSCKQEAAVK